MPKFGKTVCNNITIRDVPVDIYGGLCFFPEGREIFSPTDRGENWVFFTRQGEGFFFHQTGRDFFSKNPGDNFFQQSNKS